MMSVVQSADMYVLVWHGRFTIDSLQKLMDVVGVLDDSGLSPTHFGVPDSRAHEYSATALRRWWLEKDQNPCGLALYRRAAPNYTMTALSGSAMGYWSPEILFKKRPSSKWPPKLFELHRRMSRLMRPLFATVLPHFKGTPGSREDRAACNITTRHDLLVFGLPPLGARTWLGPHAVAQIGLDHLRRAPGVVLREHDDGAVEVDLADAPWTLDGPARVARARSVTRYLAESGAFGDYSARFREDRPANPHWVPPPDAIVAAGLSSGLRVTVQSHEAPTDHLDLLQTINIVLKEHDVQPLDPPHARHADPFVAFIPRVSLHLLQRIFVLDRYAQPVTPPGGTPTPRDYELIRDASYDLDSHLLCHSDREGLYVPVAFRDPIFDDRLPGGILGSSMGLRDELEKIAAHIDLSAPVDEASTTRLVDEQPDDHPFARERRAWAVLHDATRASHAHRAPIVFR